MQNRQNGEGNYYKDPINKSWEYRFTYVDLSGASKRGKRRGKTKNLAKQKAEQFLMSLEKQRDMMKNSDKTVSSWINRWLTDYINPNVRPRTSETYKSVLLNHVVPYLGNRLLCDLSTQELQSHFSELQKSGGREKKGLSPTTIRTIRRYFSMAMDDAIKAGLIDVNPVKLTKAPKLEKIEIITINEAEMEKLIIAASHDGEDFWDHTLPVIIHTALATGMRQGELFGLQWQDVDIKNCCINVKRTLIHAVGKGVILQEPKTKSGRRKILISKEDMNILINYFQWQNDYALSLGNKFLKSDYVFTSAFGTPIRPSNFTRRHFRPACDRAEISKKFSFHGLRHTHATLLLKAGVHAKIVQERLGHSSVKLTMDVYSHVLPDMQQQAVDALKGIFNHSHE